MRFIEPQSVEISETTVSTQLWKTVAVVWDIHAGVYKNEQFLQKVVDAINARSDIDMIFIVWDFLYKPTQNQSIEQLLAPLDDLNRPVYAVLGNHDVGVWNETNYTLPLIQLLESFDITVLYNDIIRVDNFYLVWLGPYMSGDADSSILQSVDSQEDVVVLSHNPDATMTFPNRRADITIAWHTHCGQVRLPFIHESIRSYIIPVDWDFDCGLTQEATTRLYITPWVGEVIFPIRLLNPPTISILTL